MYEKEELQACSLILLYKWFWDSNKNFPYLFLTFWRKKNSVTITNKGIPSRLQAVAALAFLMQNR